MTLFINWFGGEQNAQLTPVTPFSLEGLNDRQAEPSKFWFILSHILSWVVIFLLISTILVFLYLILWIRIKKRFGAFEEGESEPKRETISFGGIEPEEELPRKAPTANILSTYHGLPGGTDPTSKVIRAYYQLLNFGIRQGKPRLAKTTPIEYQPELMDLVGDDHANQFTSHFNNTYYGLIAPPDEVADEMEHNVEIILKKKSFED